MISVPTTRRVFVSLFCFALLAVGCSGSSTDVGAAPEFSEAPTTAPVAPASTTEPVEVQETPAPTADAQPPTPTEVGEGANDEPPAPQPDGEVPNVDDIDVDTLFPDPAASPFRTPETGYTPSANGEIPIIDFNNSQSVVGLDLAKLVLPLCVNDEQNPSGAYISTTTGVRCGIRIVPIGDRTMESACGLNIWPDNEIVELDPQLRVNDGSGVAGNFIVLTHGCAFQVLQQGVDAHFAAEQASE